MSQIQKFEKDLQTAKSAKELFMLQSVQERFINNYKATTNREDGLNRFEQEKFTFLTMISENPQLQNLPMFSYFSVLTFLGASGLSLRDNKVYVMPNGKGGLKVQSSPAGKREMLEMMDDIKSVPEAVLIMKGDKFIHDKANHRVVEHLSTDKSATEIKMDNIVAAYQRIIYKDKTYVDTVVLVDELIKARSKSKMSGPGSVWDTWCGEQCKKVSTNRAFRLHHKYPQNSVIIADIDREEEDSSNEKDEEYLPVTPHEVVTESGDVVDATSGEVIEEAKTINKKPDAPTDFM